MMNKPLFRLYTIVPVESEVAMLGFSDKFNSPLVAKKEFDGIYGLNEDRKSTIAVANDRTSNGFHILEMSFAQ